MTAPREVPTVAGAILALLFLPVFWIAYQIGNLGRRWSAWKEAK